MTEYQNSQRGVSPEGYEGYEGYESSEASERRSFFQRLLFGDGEEDAQESAESSSARELEESEEPRELHGFTVERAASVIKDMPEDVPWKSAVRIVRQTLTAAGIEVSELDRATRMREAKLESRIELSRGRVEELNERTDEVVTSLQQQIEKAREARDYGVFEEERKMGEAREGLSDVDLVRRFFDIQVEEPRSEASSEQLAEGPEGQGLWSESEEYREDETQILEPVEDDTRVIGDRGPQYNEDDTGPQDVRDTRDSQQSQDPYGTSEPRG